MSAALSAADQATRDIILILADSKRLLGTRYAEWILGAPELEAGIACASMAQDEWGHGRLLYALLKDFGEDTDRIEHMRDPAEYRNIEVLDRSPASWPELIVLNAFVDAALTVQLEALRESEYGPLKQRVAKLLDEEVFHAQHGVAWLNRLAAASDDAKAQVKSAVQNALPLILRWFGEGQEGDALRKEFLSRVQPLLDATKVSADAPRFDNFNSTTRRSNTAGPDAATITRVRGDKNRIYLMD